MGLNSDNLNNKRTLMYLKIESNKKKLSTKIRNIIIAYFFET